MSHLITCLLFAAGGAIVTGILVDLKWKEAAKKLIERISSLENGLSIKQSEINSLNTKLISVNSRINMMDVTLCQKDKELNELSKKVSTSATTVETKTVKKRGPYKKKRYGRPASNNNTGKKAE
jgi:chromosome segregation ATPase